MNDNKFWLFTNITVATGIVMTVFLCLLYWSDHNAKIVQLIEHGVDPVAAMCAMQDDYGTHPTCLVLAAKK